MPPAFNNETTPVPSNTSAAEIVPIIPPPRPFPVRPPTVPPTAVVPTEAPTEAPTTAAPTEAPTTAAPTEAPTTQPVVVIPTMAPTTEAPTTEAPTTSAAVVTPEIPTTAAPETTPSQEQQLPYGCLEADSNNQCTQCNSYSYLQDNDCYCAFNYKVEIERHCDENPKSDANDTYELDIYTHLDIFDYYYESSSNGTLNCTDLFFFIFDTQQTIQELQGDLDGVQCSLSHIFYIVPPTGNDSYMNVVRMTNLSQPAFEAFIQDKLEFAFDYGVLNLQCYGAPDFLVTNMGIQCGPEQQSYCQYQNISQQVSNNTATGNATAGGNATVSNETAGGNATVSNETAGGNASATTGNESVPALGSSAEGQGYSLSLLENNGVYSLNISNLPFMYTGQYTDPSTDEVNCNDVIYVQSNQSSGNSMLRNCYVYEQTAEAPSNESSSNATQNTSASDNNTSPSPSSAETPTPAPSDTSSAVVPSPEQNNTVPTEAPVPSESGQVVPVFPPPEPLNATNFQGLIINIDNLTLDEVQQFLNNSIVFNLNMSNLQFQSGISNTSVNTSEPFVIVGVPSLLPASNESNQTNQTAVVVQCSDNCSVCDNSTGMCDLCDDGYLLIPIGSDNNTCIQNPCNENQTYNALTNSCDTKCDVGCAQCNSNGDCLVCDINYFKLYQDYTKRQGAARPNSLFKCVQQCPVDLYTNYRQRECSLCDADCSQCQESMFFRCPFDASLYASCDDKKPVVLGDQVVAYAGKLNCQRRCQDGYYGFMGWCHQCSSQCKSCLSFYQCLTCPEYTALSNQTCISPVCSSGTYVERDGSCQNCSSNCTECSLDSNNCTACADGFQVVDGQCVESTNATLQAPPVCKAGFFGDVASGQCLSCSQNCQQCNDASNCTQCSSFSYKLYNASTATYTCVSSCPLGTYSSNAARECKACLTPNCKVCAPEYTCWTCNHGYFKSRKTCFNTCPDGQYIGQDFLKYYQCQTCPQPCISCGSKDTCKQCQAPFIKVSSQFSDVPEVLVQKTLQSTCVSSPDQCPIGTYYEQQANQCWLCPRGCAACDSQGNCTQQCDLSSQNVCSSCLSKPANCTSQQPQNQTQQCGDGQILVVNTTDNSTSCQPLCNATGQYYDNDTQTCQNCMSNCSKCTNQNTCLQCASGFYTQIIGGAVSCVDQCQPGYFAQDSSQQCKNCPKNCVNCTQGNRCDACDYETQLDPQSGRCYCALKYTAYLTSTSSDVVVQLTNVQWDDSVLGDFTSGGQNFNCSDIFDFNLINSTAAANLDNVNDTLQNFNSLQCSGSYAPDGNYATVTIHNVSDIMQTLIRLQLVQITLVPGSYHVSCVQFGPLSLSIVSADESNLQGILGLSGGRRLQLSEISAASPMNLFEEDEVLKDIDHALQEQGDQLKLLIDQQTQEDKFYKDVLKSQEHQEKEQKSLHEKIRHLNVVLIVGILMIVAFFIVRKIVKNNNKKRMLIVYERSKSEFMEDEDMKDSQKGIEMSKIKEDNQDKKENVELLQ